MQRVIFIFITMCSLATASSASEAERESVDARDVLLLLDRGPLHLRFQITLDGKSLTEAREEYLKRLITRLDANKDGRVSETERRKSPLFTAGRRKIENEFLNSLNDDKTANQRDIERDLARFGGGAPVSYRQDDSASENDLAVFKALDVDGSGRVEPGEMRTAAARIAAMDQDRDQCIGYEEFLPQPDPMTAMTLQVNMQPAEDRPRPRYSDLMRDMHERLLSARVMKKYDRNRNGRLTSDELGWTAERVASLDANGNKELSLRELDDLVRSPVDLEMSIELVGDEKGPSIKVVGSAADRRIPSPRPDLVRLEFGGTKVTFSCRKIEPIVSAVENAMQTFNEIDLDANGYIDRTEITDRFRFERYFFDAMDADGDDKIFAEEMREYVTVVCEPAGATCQVNLYDTGQGYFQMLDDSGDGRISIRELRTIEESLKNSTRDMQTGLTPKDRGRHYHIEFVRGSYQLFGRSERMVVQGPTFIQRPTVGPIWFQRMDRNSDGDLTWNEFLGPREVFHKLDEDQDGLIDYKEAEKANEL